MNGTETKHFAYFMRRLAMPGEHYVSPESGARSVMDSSLNQRAGPRDCNYFLRDEWEDGVLWHVLADYEGPGCLVRFFMAGEDQGDGDIEFYIDNEKTPRLRTTIRRLFQGKEWPFLRPFVMDREHSSEGRVSYVPIPFRERCIIRSNSESPNFYWQWNALLYEEGTAIESFPAEAEASDREAMAAAAEAWQAVDAERMRPDAGAAGRQRRSFALPAGEETVVFRSDEGGTIRVWSADTAGVAREALAKLLIKMYWDGGEKPDVCVPFLHFYCQGSKDADFASLLLERNGSFWTCGIPMPYRSGAIVTLENRGDEPCALGMSFECLPGPAHETLRFRSRYERKEMTYGTIYSMLRVKGSGLLIGMNQITEQVGVVRSVANFNQEGNEYMYVDDDRDPSWIGTGTEDHYNCAYYYRRGEVARQTHGCLELRCTPDQLAEDAGRASIATDGRGRVSAYRMYVLDAVPFRRRLHVVQEAGCPRKGVLSGVNGEERLVYEWTCYWYESDGAGGDGQPSPPEVQLTM